MSQTDIYYTWLFIKNVTSLDYVWSKMVCCEAGLLLLRDQMTGLIPTFWLLPLAGSSLLISYLKHIRKIRKIVIFIHAS